MTTPAVAEASTYAKATADEMADKPVDEVEPPSTQTHMFAGGIIRICKWRRNLMQYQHKKYTLFLYCACALFWCDKSSASTIIASKPMGFRANYSYGALVGYYSYNGSIDRITRAQTFTASQSGYVETVSLAVNRASSTTAPLQISITDTVDGLPHSTLAVVNVDPSEIQNNYDMFVRYTVVADFTSAQLFLEEGTVYALVIDTVKTPGNTYWIEGAWSYYTYPDGNTYRSSDGSTWLDSTHGDDDLFFEVTTISPPAIRALTVLTNNLVQLTWTNSTGEIWIDQSINLRDWEPIAGPFTNSSEWSGVVGDENQQYFRIRLEF